MNANTRPWPPSCVLLAVAAIMLIGTGGYFLLLRPPLPAGGRALHGHYRRRNSTLSARRWKAGSPMFSG